jgi:hypothetical protein
MTNVAKTVTRTVGNYELQVFYLPPKAAVLLLNRLLKVVGEPLAEFLDAFVSNKGSKERSGSLGSSPLAKGLDTLLDRDLPPNLFGNVARALIGRIDDAEVARTYDELIAKVWIKGPEDNGTHKILDRDLEGKPGLALKVLATCLEVQFEDFFAEAGGFAGVLDQVKAMRQKV